MAAEKDTRKEAKERREASLARKMDKAKEYDSRVITAKDYDTNTFLNLITQTDRALSNAKARIGVSIEPNDILGAIAKIRDCMVIVEEVTIELCKKTGTRYFQPKAIKEYKDKIKADASVEEGKKSK